MSNLNYSTSAEKLQEFLNEKIENIEKRQILKKQKIEKKLLSAIEKESVKENVKNCGTFVELNNEGQVIASNFCHHRLCNICNWRSASKKWHRTKNIIDKIGQATYVHMVLTLRNCTSEELNNTINHIMQSINRMCSRPKFKKRVLGYIRSLEITYNPEEKNGLVWHPHYHYILCLPKDYLTNTDLYLSTYEWRKMWEKSARIDYNTQFCFDVIKGDEISNAVAEVSKYAVKASKVFSTLESTSELKALLKAISGRRMYSLGGIIKEYDVKEKWQSEEEKILQIDTGHCYVFNGKEYIKYSNSVYKQENVNQKGGQDNEGKPP